MIKFRAKGKNGDLYGFGLSARNIELLKNGKPIVIDMMEVGIPGMTITIVYEETEEALVRELQRHGVLPESFDPSLPEPGETKVFRNLTEGKVDYSEM